MKISVITAAYNSSGTIKDAVDSLCVQTCKDFEHILVDGGSADGTLALVKTVSPGSIVVSEPDAGIYDAMNKGIQLATVEVLGTLNADDLYADNSVLQRVAEVFKDPAVDVCYGDLVYVLPGDTSKQVRIWRSSPYRAGLFLKGWVPPHPTFFVRRRVYQKLGGFDLAFPLAADFELMLRFLHCAGLKSVYIPVTLVKMRTGGATNKNLANILKQNVEIYLAGRKNNVQLGPRYFAGKFYDRFKQYLRAKCA